MRIWFEPQLSISEVECGGCYEKKKDQPVTDTHPKARLGQPLDEDVWNSKLLRGHFHGVDLVGLNKTKGGGYDTEDELQCFD
jgi:hypothetical protein